MKSKEIGKSILDVRKKNKLTQKAFADILHVTYQAVSKWETGKSIPDIGTLNLISKTFNVDLNEIINGEKKDVKKRNIIILWGKILFLLPAQRLLPPPVELLPVHFAPRSLPRY